MSHYRPNSKSSLNEPPSSSSSTNGARNISAPTTSSSSASRLGPPRSKRSRRTGNSSPTRRLTLLVEDADDNESADEDSSQTSDDDDSTESRVSTLNTTESDAASSTITNPNSLSTDSSGSSEEGASNPSNLGRGHCYTCNRRSSIDRSSIRCIHCGSDFVEFSDSQPSETSSARDERFPDWSLMSAYRRYLDLLTNEPPPLRVFTHTTSGRREQPAPEPEPSPTPTLPHTFTRLRFNLGDSSRSSSSGRRNSADSPRNESTDRAPTSRPGPDRRGRHSDLYMDFLNSLAEASHLEQPSRHGGARHRAAAHLSSGSTAGRSRFNSSPVRYFLRRSRDEPAPASSSRYNLRRGETDLLNEAVIESPENSRSSRSPSSRADHSRPSHFWRGSDSRSRSPWRRFRIMGDDDLSEHSAIIITTLINQLRNRGPAPASESQISNLPVVDINQDLVDRGSQCAICMDDYTLNEKAKKLPCNHLFHEPCIAQWLKLHGTCPVCRKNINEDNEAQSSTSTRRGNADPTNDSSRPFITLMNYYDISSRSRLAGAAASSSNSTSASSSSSSWSARPRFSATGSSSESPAQSSIEIPLDNQVFCRIQFRHGHGSSASGSNTASTGSGPASSLLNVPPSTSNSSSSSGSGLSSVSVRLRPSSLRFSTLTSSGPSADSASRFSIRNVFGPQWSTVSSSSSTNPSSATITNPLIRPSSQRLSDSSSSSSRLQWPLMGIPRRPHADQLETISDDNDDDVMEILPDDQPASTRGRKRKLN